MPDRPEQKSRWRITRRSRRKSGVIGTLESSSSAHDILYPRDAEHRYRIYAVNDTELEVLASSPTAGGVGQALVTIHADMKEHGMALSDLGAIGVLDVLGGDKPTGEWIVLPWQRNLPPLTIDPRRKL